MKAPTTIAALIMLFALTLVATPARAASEICFDSTNAGAVVNYYVFRKTANDRDGDYTSPRGNLWEWRTEVSAEPRRCVHVNDIRGVKPGDLVRAGWQVEGKRVGRHTFVCRGDIGIDPDNLHRAMFTITGSTIFNTSCRREQVSSGEFLVHNNGNRRVSEVCFDNANHGAVVDYRLATNQRMIWRANTNYAHQKRKCIKVDTIDGVRGGKQLRAFMPVHGALDSSRKFMQCRDTVFADPKSKAKALFRTVGWTTFDAKCTLSLYVPGSGE